MSRVVQNKLHPRPIYSFLWTKGETRVVSENVHLYVGRVCIRSPRAILIPEFWGNLRKKINTQLKYYLQTLPWASNSTCCYGLKSPHHHI